MNTAQKIYLRAFSSKLLQRSCIELKTNQPNKQTPAVSKMFNETKFFTASASVFLIPDGSGYDTHKQPTDQQFLFYLSQVINSYRF